MGSMNIFLYEFWTPYLSGLIFLGYFGTQGDALR
jgi:hypothetical protein